MYIDCSSPPIPARSTYLLAQIPQHDARAVSSGGAHHPASRVGASATQIQAPQRRPVAAEAGGRPCVGQLVEAERAMED